jgi:gliding motility-associated-like protein
VAPVTGIFANPSGTICAGQSVTFSASQTSTDTANGGSAVKYEWYVNGGTVLATTPTFTTTTLANNDVVKVNYISSLRCLINDNKVATNKMTMKVNTPVVTINGIFTFCSTDATGVLTANDNGSGTDQVTGNLPTYTWTTVAGTFSGNTIPQSKLTDKETVKVTMTPGYACNGTPATASQLITIYQKPVADLIATPPVICPGDFSNLVATGGTVPGSSLISYTWFKDNSTIAGSTNGISVSAAGVYKVKITNGLPACYGADSTPVSIQNVVVDAGPDKSMYKGNSVILEGSSNGSYSYMWSPGISLSDSTILQPTAAPSTTTYYNVTATSTLGCTASDQVMVEVFIPIKVPNAFSPNGDGLNDVWVIDGMEKYPNSKVNVFNRWGNAIYSDNNGYKSPWDGHEHGQALASGTYYYVIDLKGSPDNTDQTVTGSLTIVR